MQDSSNGWAGFDFTGFEMWIIFLFNTIQVRCLVWFYGLQLIFNYTSIRFSCDWPNSFNQCLFMCIASKVLSNIAFIHLDTVKVKHWIIEATFNASLCVCAHLRKCFSFLYLFSLCEKCRSSRLRLWIYGTEWATRYNARHRKGSFCYCTCNQYANGLHAERTRKLGKNWNN